MEDNTNTSGLVIEFAPTGAGTTGTLTARLGDDVLHVDKLDVAKAKARDGFLGALCEGRSGIPREEAESKLKRLASEVANRSDGEKPPTAIKEIDVSRIVRPERFITPEVSGLAVATMTEFCDKPMGRWLLYLHWSDGRRECIPIPSSIELSDKSKLWIHPEPSEPAASMRPGWSVAKRQAWLKGAKSPEPSRVFRRVCDRIAHFLDIPRGQAPGATATLSLWAILSYVYPAWNAVPYLYIGGPLASGKSRVFEVLARLVFRSLSSSNLTGAAMFRTLHNQGGVLLLDEAERLRDTRSPDVGDVMSMLLAGYKRGGQATRLEPVGDTFKTLSFDVYGPKALACIAGLPPALASRAIPIIMFRAAPGSEKPRRRIDAEPDRWQTVRDDLHVLALEHGPTWLELSGRTDVCPAMSGRDFELWQPLLALASWIESHGAEGLLGLMQEHALAVIDSGRDDATPDADATLLRILADAVRANDRVMPAEVLERARAVDGETFKRWRPETVARRLISYGIPKARKSGSRREYRDVTPDILRQIQASYGIDLDFPEEATEATIDPASPSQPSQPSQNRGEIDGNWDSRDSRDGN